MAADAKISEFKSRDADTISMTINGQTEGYTIIKIFPFTSERKAMSIVLQHPTEAKAICFVKGADSSVFPMCEGYSIHGKGTSGLNPSDPNGKIYEVERSVEDMAKKGLRTLLYGKKEI